MSTLLSGIASSLAHSLVFGSDTICNDLGLLLVDIVLVSTPFEEQPPRWHIVSGSDTICNGPGLLLADIVLVLFGLFLLSFSSTF